jgi:hypothetical protein
VIAAQTIGEFLRAGMPLPNEMASEEQYNRTYHFDVEPAPTADLERELAAIRTLLYFAPDSSPWFYQREAVIRDEVAKRRAT